MMLEVKDFYQRYAEALKLELCAGDEGLRRSIRVPEIERPGLCLTGFLKGHSPKRILVFGRVEMEYMRHLGEAVRKKRLASILSPQLPLIILSRRLKPYKEMIDLCDREKIPLFRTSLTTSQILQNLT